MKDVVFIGLGSNMGEKELNIKRAVELIRGIARILILKESSLYLSKAWGKEDQADFVNQVVKLKTILPPEQLLHRLQEIEIKMGRQRKEKWGPRIIDLDILLYGDRVISTEELTVPHPYMQERLFVLYPLQELEPELIFPDGIGIKEVLSSVYDREGGQGVKKYMGSPAEAPEKDPACIREDRDGNLQNR